MTATLSERYLHAATRSAPEHQRDELRRELAERIGDDIDARIQDGADPAQAEVDALTALGDPDTVAASYLERPQHLIGPQHYPLWSRLLRRLIVTVVPIVAVVFPLAQALAAKPFGEIVGSTVVVLVTLVVHLGFWTTLVFVVLERSAGSTALIEWTPDLLPEVHEQSTSAARWDVAANLAFIAVAAAAILVHESLLPFQDATGATVPLLDPTTWGWLQWYLLALLAVDAVFWVVLYRAGRWGYAFAGARILLSAAYAVPIAWGFAAGRLLNPEFLDRAGWGSDLLEPGGTLSIVFAFATVAIAAAWPIDAALKARAARRGG